MKRTIRSFRGRNAFGLLFALTFFVAPIYGAEQNAVISRDAKIDNVQLHYLTAGHGPAVILLHGFAETSRMWRPLYPVTGREIHCDRTRSAGDRRFVGSDG